ncbi:hypothetical protein [Kitasatospora sp. NPDC059327]|uniref:hypothetical protein n=1 Tax=Kitasatospora sp. NPDC059327 TaxID=3346803 RepID=UPI0036857A6B
METVGSAGSGVRAWPELLAGRRPVLVVPAALGCVTLPGEGWVGREAVPDGGPSPGWSGVLVGGRLTVRRPGGAVWFDDEVAATREWRRRVREYRTVLLVTGPFASVLDFPSAAAAGRLHLLTAPFRLADGP